MQVSSIGNTNFGINFNTPMCDLLEDGRKYVIQRNYRSKDHWDRYKKQIANMFDQTFMLHALEQPNGDIAIFLKDLKEETSIKKDPGSLVLTLRKLFNQNGKLDPLGKSELEHLDAAYIRQLKINLEGLLSKYKISKAN